MSGNSLESLLAWMKDGSAMLGWGLIFAFDRRKANLLIAQEYVRRFGAESYLPAIRGKIDIVEDQWMEFIHDYVLAVPKLSFENADLNDSKATLSMAVMGGSQFTLKKEGPEWKANKVDEIDPLQGPKLYLDLLLNEVPGDVDNEGRVRLDLSRSDNFRLTFGQSSHEQRMGGDFFKDLFNQLPDDKRIYPLGVIQRGANALMSPQSFELRTQASGPAARDRESADYGNGAILALITTEKRSGGNFPGRSYKYLIPDDSEKNYSATALLDRKEIIVLILVEQLARTLQIEPDDGFDYTYNNVNELVAATAKSGGIVFEGIDSTIGVDLGGIWINCPIKLDGFNISAVGRTSPIVEVIEGGLAITWVPSVMPTNCKITFNFAELEPYESRCHVDISLRVEYELDDTGGKAVLRQKKFDSNFEVSYETPFPDPMESTLYLLVFLQLPRVVKEFFSAKIKESFDVIFESEIFVNRYISDVLRLGFGQAIQGEDIYAPHDIGFFGRINPTQTSFAISPMEPLLHQGSTLQFSTDPVVTGVQWTVENLIEGPDNPGTINNNGLYQAPPASAITGRYTRVRVTATDLATKFFSSALVTVVVNELTVNPLIQICDVGASVELAAGQLGTGALQWSIKNPVAGESGELRPSDIPERDHTYHHGPVVAKKTFVLDEIEVKSGAALARSVHVLALQKPPGLTVSITSIDTEKGQVQLQAFFNGIPWDAEWSLPLGGPGTVATTGLYQAFPTATERFALIFALLDGGAYGTFEGYLILPLPLVEFPALLQVLRQ